MNRKLRIQTPYQMMKNCKSEDESRQQLFCASLTYLKCNQRQLKFKAYFHSGHLEKKQRPENEERILCGKRCFL